MKKTTSIILTAVFTFLAGLNTAVFAGNDTTKSKGVSLTSQISSVGSKIETLENALKRIEKDWVAADVRGDGPTASVLKGEKSRTIQELEVLKSKKNTLQKQLDEKAKLIKSKILRIDELIEGLNEESRETKNNINAAEKDCKNTEIKILIQKSLTIWREKEDLEQQKAELMEKLKEL